MTNLTAGLGLKPEHFALAEPCTAPGLWFEVHPENYLMAGGPRLAWLERIRGEHPLSLHSVAMALAAPKSPDDALLDRLAALCERFEPALVSCHLAWNRWGDVHLPDLLPVPRTDEALGCIVANLGRVQERLQRQVAIENPSHYLALDDHEYEEVDFLAAIAARSGCALLLDVNNVHVGARNLGTDPAAYIDSVPAALVAEVHLAGHSHDPALGQALLIDSHDAPVSAEVWSLYERLIARTGARPTLIERDGNLPAFDALLAERERAHLLLCSPGPDRGRHTVRWRAAA